MLMRTNVSAIARLQQLPAVFRGADLTIRFGWASKTASHYLYLWKKRGLVAPLGGHSDVFANLLTSEHADWEAALLLAHPSALVVGLEALRRSGWITQIPALPTVAVDEGESSFTVDHFDIQRQPEAWMRAVRAGINSPASGTLPSLRPAWALLDLVASQGWGLCGLQPDDVDWDSLNAQDEADWAAAARAWRLPPMPFRPDS